MNDLKKWIANQYMATVVSRLPKSLLDAGLIEQGTYTINHSGLDDDDETIELMDPFEFTFEITDEIIANAVVNAEDNTLYLPVEDGHLELIFMDIYRPVIPGAKGPTEKESVERSSLCLRKATFIGETIGLLAQKEDGSVAAITDMGRVTWLKQDVIGIQ